MQYGSSRDVSGSKVALQVITIALLAPASTDLTVRILLLDPVHPRQSCTLMCAGE